MKALFLKEAKDNKVSRSAQDSGFVHPEDRMKSPTRSGLFDASTPRMPEFAAPDLAARQYVTVDAELGENATGVLYALGGSSGGLPCSSIKVTSSTSTT